MKFLLLAFLLPVATITRFSAGDVITFREGVTGWQCGRILHIQPPPELRLIVLPDGAQDPIPVDPRAAKKGCNLQET